MKTTNITNSSQDNQEEIDKLIEQLANLEIEKIYSDNNLSK